MALVRNKKIIIDKSFLRDPLYVDNTYLKNTDRTTFPITSSDVQLRSNLPIFYSINNVLNKLVYNDLFIQKYGLMILNTTQDIDLVRVNEAFSQNITNTSSNKFESDFATHYDTYHLGNTYTKLSSLPENCMMANFSNFDERLVYTNFLDGNPLSSTDNVIISNDIVVDVEYSDDDPKSYLYLKMSIYNDKTDEEFKTSIDTLEVSEMTDELPSIDKIPYIYKRWLSGLKEFFIYLPTSFTFYNEGNGIVNVRGQSSDLDDKATWIRLQLSKRKYKFNHIYYVLICGLSLPLQIHNTTSNKYFSDISQPSIVRTLPMSTNSMNNADSVFVENTNFYCLYFTCYGSDAQAIRILAD